MPQTEEESKLKVLLRSKIDSEEHKKELITLAEKEGLEYGTKGKWFFIQLIINVKEKL